MNDLRFLDRDGQPIPGKNPVQVRVYGQGDEQAARAACERPFGAFLEEVRQGGLSQLQRAFAVPGLCTVRFSHMFGVTTVDIHLVPTKGAVDEEFYGGIVVKLVEPLTAFTSAAAATPGDFAFRWPYSPLPAPGALPTKGANRAGPVRTAYESLATTALWAATSVPTQMDTAKPVVKKLLGGETRLVLQIKRGANLADKPIAKKAIRIFRIGGNASIKPFVEVSPQAKYLLSANADIFNNPGVIDGWSLAGQPLTWIPPLNYTDTTLTLSRLCTIGMKATSVTSAPRVRGFVVVALGGKLYIYGPGTTTWVTLASVDNTTALWNMFGDQVTETTDAGGNVLLKCEGTNKAGPCSSFTVSLTRTAAGYNVSGTLTLQSVNPTTVPASATSTATRTITSTPSAGATQAVTWSRTLQTFDFFGTPIGPFSSSGTLFTWEPRNYLSTASGFVRAVSLGRPSYPDPYLTRSTPGSPTVTAEFTMNSTIQSTSAVEAATYTSVYDPAGWELDSWTTNWYFLKKTHTISYSASLAITGPNPTTLTDTGSNTRITYAGPMDYGVYPGTYDHPPTVNPPNLGSATNSGPSFPTGSSTGSRTKNSRSVVTQAFDRTHYTAIDGHIGAMALSRRAAATFTLGPRTAVTLPTPDPESSGAIISFNRWYYTTVAAAMVAGSPSSGVFSGTAGWGVGRTPYQVFRGIVRNGTESLTDLSSTMASTYTTSTSYTTSSGYAIMSEVPSGYINGPGFPAVATTAAGSASVTGWFALMRSYDRIKEFDLPAMTLYGVWNQYEYSTPSGSNLQTLLPGFSLTVSSSDSATPVSYSQAAWQAAYPAAYYQDVSVTLSVTPLFAGNQVIRTFEPAAEVWEATPPCGPIFDCVLRDMRTGGYVIQQMWSTLSSTGPDQYTTIQNLVVGNDVSEVPLVDVIAEWLISTGAASPVGTVSQLKPPPTQLFIHPDTPEVSLL